MLTMSADRWILLLALCFTRADSNDEHLYEDYHEDNQCETQKLKAPLGSSVFLPCSLSTSSQNWVTWTQGGKAELAKLSFEGRVKFLDPRHGRVKAFPNQVSEGNFSIRIDELNNSDLGSYRCIQGDYCQKVELLADSTLSTEMLLLISISAGVAALILLSVAGYFCCKKCVVPCHNKTQDNANNPVNAGIEGASAPPAPPAAVHGQQIGPDNNSLVYENDDQYFASAAPARHHGGHPGAMQNQPSQAPSGIYPNLSEFKMERVESQRTRMRFHIELINRLRHASLSRHYYVNQGELRKQQAMSTQAENHHRAGVGKKKAKEDGEYKNPIYNRSTDQLNHL
ncbi:uncharacterized protein LOC111566100 isoform X3 [Amphiprion ocellaris]|uniref:uncharacterized protein LOC111566100 isoform X3 n=1 Tax=Amphiprion ocellaris TaxID=80972 RepID=UPI002410C4D2|nr:uncharacterized protein LOC111566100 isoform X3 [Amphiprion ocellaris]